MVIPTGFNAYPTFLITSVEKASIIIPPKENSRTTFNFCFVHYILQAAQTYYCFLDICSPYFCESYLCYPLMDPIHMRNFILHPGGVEPRILCTKVLCIRVLCCQERREQPSYFNAAGATCECSTGMVWIWWLHFSCMPFMNPIPANVWTGWKRQVKTHTYLATVLIRD